MKPRKGLSVYVLLVGILGLLIVAGFFAFQLFDEATKSQVPAEQRELVKPLEGSINPKVIENLRQRRIISKEEVVAIVQITPSVEPTVRPQMLETSVTLNQATASASISATPNASPAATTNQPR